MHPVEPERAFAKACDDFESNSFASSVGGSVAAASMSTESTWFPCSFKIRHGQQTGRCLARLMWCVESAGIAEPIESSGSHGMVNNNVTNNLDKEGRYYGTTRDDAVVNEVGGGSSSRTSSTGYRSSSSCDTKRLLYLRVLFEEPQRALSPGQILALYDEDICLGGVVL